MYENVHPGERKCTVDSNYVFYKFVDDCFYGKYITNQIGTIIVYIKGYESLAKRLSATGYQIPGNTK